MFDTDAPHRYVDDAMSATVATVDLDRTMSGFTDAFGHPRDPRIGEAEFPFGGFYEAGDPFLRSAKVCCGRPLQCGRLESCRRDAPDRCSLLHA